MMKKMCLWLGVSLYCTPAVGAIVTVGSWMPLFKGVELASGQQISETGTEPNLQVRCLRVDLTDPDVRFFTTPHCTNGCSQETLSENTSRFLERNGLQVAMNCGFYSPADPTALDVPLQILGLSISQGVTVSPADHPAFVSLMLFTSNNVPILVPTNSPNPGTTGIYTAIAGNHTLLTNGVNLMVPNPFDRDPRTSIGLSQDRHYLLLMAIDGRQAGWSDGCDFYTTAEWLKRFGATDGINMDGGGSTTMVKANCIGAATRLNRPSYVASSGRERYIGHNFGIQAVELPGDLKNFTVVPEATTATLTWHTDVPATTQVQYGLTTNYGSATPLDSRLARNHVATIDGLIAGTTYYFSAISTFSGQTLTQACQFTTTTPFAAAKIFDLNQVWSFTTNNLDGINWTSPVYDETNWLGQGASLLFVETAAYVYPRNTALPSPVSRTYYFRTWFSLTNDLTGGFLLLSNYVDDGAVFYLNGAELYRLRMPAAPTQILNSTLASGTPCAGFATAGDAATNCPDLFVVGGNVLTNLVAGDNLLAVEAHNSSAGSTDIVFGSALFALIPTVVLPRLNLWVEDNVATFFWNGEDFTLQHASALGASPAWADVPGPITGSPHVVTNPAAGFYRLRQ